MTALELTLQAGIIRARESGFVGTAVALQEIMTTLQSEAANEAKSITQSDDGRTWSKSAS